MSKEQLHGLVLSLREYLEYETMLEPDLGYSSDDALESAWHDYKKELEEKMLAQVREAIGGGVGNVGKAPAFNPVKPPAPTVLSPSHPQNRTPDLPSEESEIWRNIGAVTRAPVRPPTPTQAPSGTTASSARRPPASPPYNSQRPTSAPYNSQHPTSTPGDAQQPTQPPSPQQRRQRSDTNRHSDRKINRERAVTAHLALQRRGPFGWIEGKWYVPEEPPAGFTKDEKLQMLRAYLQNCRRCKLCEHRTKLVCDDGSPDAPVMFIGEGPGKMEDETGVPFVGRAGELLSNMIAAMSLDRQKDVYIANVVKCRPPRNRDPEPDEIAQCLIFLRKQIEAVSPKVIVLLGRIAFSSLLPQLGGSIKQHRGKWYSYMKQDGTAIPVMPTFHPAYLLHAGPESQQAKGLVWHDLQMVMAKLAEVG